MPTVTSAVHASVCSSVAGHYIFTGVAVQIGIKEGLTSQSESAVVAHRG